MLTAIGKAVRRDIQDAHDRGSCHGKAGKRGAWLRQIVDDLRCSIAVICGIQQMVNIHPADAMATRASLHDINKIKAGLTTSKWLAASG